MKSLQSISTTDVHNKKVTPSAVAEFEAAMTDYKRSSGRMFPTWTEVLEVLRGLGYAKPVNDAFPPRCRVLVSGQAPERQEIADLLTRSGGVCVDAGTAPVYEFPSMAACQESLEAARSAFGWASVVAEYMVDDY